MLRQLLGSSTVLLALVLGAAVGCAAPRAVGGELNLEGWNFERNGLVTLDGEWEFYGNVLLPPEAFATPGAGGTPQLVHVPGSWLDVPDHTGVPMGREGYATYRLRIRLPAPGEQEEHPRQELAIAIPYANTAYVMWVDGQLVAANGTVSPSPEQGQPQFLPQVGRFQPVGPVADVVIHVSNYHFREGGLPRRLELGTAEQMTLRQVRLEVTGAAFFGASVIMAVFFAGIWALRREQVADMYFSLFLLVVALRMLVTGDHILARATGGIPWELGLKLEYFTGYAAPVLFFSYLEALFPDDVSQRTVRLWSSVGIAGIAATLVLPGRLSSLLIPPYLLLTMGMVAYCIYIGLRAVIRRRPDSVLFLGGVLATSLATFLALLRYAGMVLIGELVPAAIIVLVLSQSLVLAARSARAYRQIVTLAAENAQMLETTQWQLKKLREYRRLTTLREENLRRRIAEMLHGRTQGRLFAVLQRIDQAARIMEEDVPAARAHLSQARQLLDQVREEDIRRTSRQLHPAAVGAGMLAAIESLLDRFDESHKVHFEVDPAVEALDQGERGGIRYVVRLGAYRIVEEGLNNIFHHANAQNIHVSIGLTRRDGKEYLELTLKDDGVGFDPEKPTRGLGLQTIDARVGDLGGEWELTGAPGQGTTLHVLIPLIPGTSD